MWSSAPLRGAAVLAFLTATELLISEASIGAVFAGLGLAAGLGALFGWLLTLLNWGLSKTPRAVAVLLWVTLGGLFGGWQAHSLGVMARFGGKDHQLAVAATVASVGLALTVALVGLAFQTRRATGSTWISQRARWLRVTARLMLIGGGVGCVAADQLVFSDSYAEAHQALRLIALWSLTLALMPLGAGAGEVRAEVEVPRSRWVLAHASVVALFVAGWLTLTLGPSARLVELLDEPIADNKKKKGRAKNRRIEFKVLQ